MTDAQLRAFELLPIAASELRSNRIRPGTLERMRDAGLCFYRFTGDRWESTELGRIAAKAARERAKHRLEPSRCGAQSGYATGRCKCGWSYSGWTDRATDVRASFTRHVEAAIAKAVEGAQS